MTTDTTPDEPTFEGVIDIEVQPPDGRPWHMGSKPRAKGRDALEVALQSAVDAILRMYDSRMQAQADDAG